MFVNDYHPVAVFCDGSQPIAFSPQGVPIFSGMPVNIIEPQPFGFLFSGNPHSELFQPVLNLEDVSVAELVPCLCSGQPGGADQFLPVKLSRQVSELSAQPASTDKVKKTLVAKVAGASRVSKAAANVQSSGVGRETLPVGRNEGSKRTIPTMDNFSYGNISQRRLNMISELESGLSTQLLKRLRDESKKHLPTEEEKFNVIVRYFKKKSEHFLVKKYGVNELADYIVNDFSFRVPAAERDSFMIIKRDAMQSYAYRKRRKINDAYLELLKRAKDQKATSGLTSTD